ncbi:hypothetical protein GCM10010954_14780 [Halobacillus andaensis]|uniref:Uncharacterized protein n=1 Tax=Halobacillus andaensis TaxID=1176239 RepID=A0A917EUR0_HALAA|nr:hypothetical protein [Halobacillus andaensis]MBP2005020.1 flagellar basal body-associated protein FliL [Halobacillus andaensis]GGF17154.1 hypothetical protein GCM10010954_14780 [Halobacillus andaensis]
MKPSNKYIRSILKWVLLALILAMILVGIIVAYLFIADMLYEEEKDDFNENGEVSMPINVEIDQYVKMSP